MPEFVVAAESRVETGKNVNRRLRSRGMIPGVLYASGKQALAVSVSPQEIGSILRSATGENTLFDLDLGGSRRKVILKEFQREPLRGKLLHADFYEVALDKVLQVKVHVELEGVPAGVKLQGGIVDFVTRELEVECLPSAIPQKLALDVSEVRVGQHLEAKDVALPAGVELIGEPDRVVVSVGHARVEAEAPTAAAAVPEAAEPEVIARGKKEEEKAS